tara:strand:- start:229 stop:1224 length:996 start_codon:yes stop_codon:yes gene_type:complete
MSINLNEIIQDNPVFLAPMSGITDLPFRLQVQNYGNNLVFSEMNASSEMVHLLKNDKRFYRNEFINRKNGPVAFQIAGWDPQVMSCAASLLEERGAQIIDINMGCPAKKVVKRYAGSALMKDLLLARDIIASVVKATSLPTTLKIRIGWDEDTKNAPELAKIAENYGIKLITVHGRTRHQFYKGVADWKFISKVKQNVKIPVVANGDIVCFDTAKKCLRDSTADGIMVGRACYGRPWFLSKLSTFLLKGTREKDPDLIEQKNVLMNHIDTMFSYYGTELGCRLSRKHIAWYTKSLPNSCQFREKIFAKISFGEMSSEIERLFDHATEKLAA